MAAVVKLVAAALRAFGGGGSQRGEVQEITAFADLCIVSARVVDDFI